MYKEVLGAVFNNPMLETKTKVLFVKLVHFPFYFWLLLVLQNNVVYPFYKQNKLGI